jgi:hypothetical protein
LLLLGTAEGVRPVPTLLYAMAGRQALVKAKRPRAARRLRRRRWKRIERKEGPAEISESFRRNLGRSWGKAKVVVAAIKRGMISKTPSIPRLRWSGGEL